MPDISPRRRWTGRALIGVAALALPLTASISYAQDEVVAPPAPPAPPSVAAVPAPPAPPAVAGAPELPAAPTPPAPPAPGDREVHIVRIVRDGAPSAPGDGKPGEKRVEKRIVIRPGEHMSAEDRAEFEADMAEMRKELGPDSEFRKEMREQFGKNGKVEREIRIAMADAHSAMAEAHASAAMAPRIVVQCRNGQGEVTSYGKDKSGQRTMFVCPDNATASARAAIANAKAQVARNKGLSAEQRAEVMASLDEAEAGLKGN